MTKDGRPTVPLSGWSRRALLVLGLALPAALIAYFLWSVGHGLLVIFAGILFAVLLDSLARLIRYAAPIRRSIALVLAIAMVSILLVGGSWLGGARLTARLPQLSRQVANSVDQLHSNLAGMTGVSKRGSQSNPNQRNTKTSEFLSYGKKLVGSVTGLLTVTATTATDAFLIAILGIYFAIAPGYYLQITGMLIPPNNRARTIEVMNIIGRALRRWLLGRILAMALVGVLTIAGLYALDIRLSFLLGVIAGVFTFVPYLGPLASAVPAILVGLSVGPFMAIYVAILYLVVHIIEGYIFTPLIQHRIVHLAPAFLLIAQLLAGLFAGVFGIIVATPLAIVLTIAVQKFYMQDILAESPRLLGDDT